MNLYYVLSNTSQSGFAIVAADDCAPAVLLQVDNANFDPDNMPLQMKALLNHYQNLIAAAIESGESLAQVTPAGAQNIDPLVRTVWQQAAPYNNDCNELVNAGLVSAAQRSLTGCVATALTQCLYYFYDQYNYQPQPSGSISYTIAYQNTSGSGIKAGNVAVNKTFGAADKIDYQNLILMYDGFEYTSAQSAAIAKFMHMAGLTLQMQYEDATGGSSAADDNIVLALKNNWGFDENVEYVTRTDTYEDGTVQVNFTDQQWVDKIFNELKNKRPVMYGAVARKSDGTDGGGHEFVIDGYRTSDALFHVNWGWENGYCNGWCYLANDDITKVLKPSSSTGGGTGTADSSEDPYANGQGAVIGIQPKNFGSMTAVSPQGVHGTKVITEGADYTNGETLTVSGVKYTRNFTGNWQALYLPFAIPAANLTDFEVAEPTTATASTVTIKKVAGTEANTVYFIKAKTAGQKTISATGKIDLVPAAKTTKTVGSYKFTGTNAAILGKNWNAAWYALNTNGKLQQTNADMSGTDNNEVEILKAHRWYLVAPAGQNAPMIIEESEQETGIGEIEETAADACIYNLNGQRVNANAKGIVIVNGKKVWNK